MFIYEKILNDARHLFASNSNLPTENDTQLTYKDTDGDSITPSLQDTYLDASTKEYQAIKIKSADESKDGKALNVFVGSTCIIGKVEEKVLNEIKITKKPTKLTYTVGDVADYTGMVVKAVYASGDKETITPTSISPASGATLSTAGTTTVTVSYKEGSVTKTATFTVKVNAAS